MVSRYVAVAVVAGLWCAPLNAQPGEREDPHLRNECRLAAQVLRTGNPAPRREWALDAIRRCEESGPQVLAEVWRAGAPTQAELLGHLFNATRDFNDRRVVDAAADVVRNTRAPEVTRIYALALLYSYAVPGRYIDTDDLFSPGDRPPRVWAVSHDTRASETRAKLGDIRPEVSELLELVISHEPEGRVGLAAAAILDYLRASFRPLHPR